MTRFEYICKNIDQIRNDVGDGFHNCSILRHWEIYATFDIYRKKGYNVTMSALFTAEDFKISDRSVMNIKKFMEKEKKMRLRYETT